ncbi:MAG: hypothetical protein ACOYON_03010 [Fimbriimonas sp.]
MPDIKKLIRDFISLHDEIEQYGKSVERRLKEELGRRDIECKVSSRMKDPFSLATKSQVKKKESISDLQDLFGLRLALPTQQDFPVIYRIILALFKDEILLEDSYSQIYLAEHRPEIFNYTASATHFILLNPKSLKDSEGKEVKLQIELQVRTDLDDTWGNVSHKGFYKSTEHEMNELKKAMRAPELPIEPSRQMNQIKADLESIDARYAQIQDALMRLDAFMGPIITKAHGQEKQQVLDALLSNNLTPEVRRNALMEQASLYFRTGELAKAEDFYKLASEVKEVHKADKAKLSRLSDQLLLHRIRDHQHELDLSKNDPAELEEWVKTFEHDRIMVGATTDPNRRFLQYATRDDRQHLAVGLCLLARIHLRSCAANLDMESAKKALECAQRVREIAPNHPFALALLITSLVRSDQELESIKLALRSELIQGIERCKLLFQQGMELPEALFLKARFENLLGKEEAFSTACLGLALALGPDIAISAKARLAAEVRWYGLCEDADDLQELFGLANMSLEVNTSDLAVVVAGSTNDASSEYTDDWVSLMEPAFDGFDGLILTGGTDAGVCRAAYLAAAKAGILGRTFGFPPAGFAISHGLRQVEGVEQLEPGIKAVLQYWRLLLEGRLDGKPIKPGNVTLLGFGGGPVSKIEYQVAAALGARVGLLHQAGRSVDEHFDNPDWRAARQVFPIVADPATYWNAIRRPVPVDGMERKEIEKIAFGIHLNYESTIDRNTKLGELSDLQRTNAVANVSQAESINLLLSRVGLTVRKTPNFYTGIDKLTEDQLRVLSEYEHGRWNIDRLTQGWRFGLERSNAHQIHPDLIPWIQDPRFPMLSEDRKPLDPKKVEKNFKRFESESKVKDLGAVNGWFAALSGAGFGIYPKD